MAQVKHGDVVRVHYTGKLVSGDQFDSSVGREPLEFTVGAGMMIKGFDDAMPGMAVGEKKTVNIPAADAYGEKDPNAIIEFPKENVPSVLPHCAGLTQPDVPPTGPHPERLTIKSLSPNAVRCETRAEIRLSVPRLR